MSFLSNLVSDSLELCFPNTCCGCSGEIQQKDDLLCVKCLHDLPYTDFEKFEDNPVRHLFTGRIQLANATALFYFSKGNIVQHILHELKYKRNAAIGEYSGKLMGERLIESGRYKDIDALIPLPLFPKKEYVRGYNQAEMICRGISASTTIPLITKNVVRQRSTETQTKKHRSERWENVAGSFYTSDPQALAHKHVMLVDDVLTTGATIEACAESLLSIEGIKISIATIAVASK